ncbi:MAG TPA: pilus assembly protein N-terminal domain-containing protein [Armatimonadota bacterium]|jgi:pilus assembly protein CpaC
MKPNSAILCISVFCLLSSGRPAAGASPVITPPPAASSTLSLTAGQSRLLRFPPISRAAIGNPAVADIAVLSGGEVLLNAKGAGETLLYVRNAKGAASVSVTVVAPPVAVVDVAGEINRALDGSGVSATSSGNAVVLRGEVDTPEAEARAIAVAKAYTNNVASMVTVSRSAASSMADTLTGALKPMGVTARASGPAVLVIEGSTSSENAATVAKVISQLASGYQIVNLVKDNVAGKQIVVHARIIAVDQLALREIGLDWGSLLHDSNGNATGVGQPIIFGENRAPGVNLDEAGPLKRLTNIGATLQALEQGNRAKTLSAPDVLVQDNHNASIVVGGEIPVPVPQLGSGGAGTIVVQFKEYGVKLNVTPRALEGGAVSMHVEPEVSTLDQTNAVFLAGFRIPAFRVRKAASDVTVQSGDTLVIGGLLQDEDVDLIRKIPILADLPLLGDLFKFRSKSRVRTQLVILVTPEVLAPLAKPPVPELANLKADSVVLPPVVAPLKPSSTEPPAMPGLSAPGRTPIPMRNSKTLAERAGLAYRQG